jgi:hypothetical protein
MVSGGVLPAKLDLSTTGFPRGGAAPDFEKEAIGGGKLTQTDRSLWFITACSTGFGRELAVQLLGSGKKMVVTARDAARVSDLVGLAPENALGLSLDVDKAGEPPR